MKVQHLLLMIIPFIGLGKVGDTRETGLQNVDNASANLIKVEIAVFKELFQNNFSEVQGHATYYYLEIRDSNNKTLPIILDKLSENTPKVKGMNEYHILSESSKESINFLSFFIDSVVINRRKATVICGYKEGSLSSSVNSIELRKKLGKWRIVKNELIRIS